MILKQNEERGYLVVQLIIINNHDHMYTFYPLETIDTLHDHTGLIALIIGMAFFCYLMYESDIDYKFSLFVTIITISIGSYFSFTDGEIKVFPNEQVVGTLVGFQAEGYSTMEQQGKMTKTVEHRKLYVVYEVPGGNTIFEASKQIVYPKQAILYKN